MILAALIPAISLLELTLPAHYEAFQASSYDRAAISPAENWFANGDYGKYLREEVNQGRKEHVMADLMGPGEVVRIWSANPAGVVRLYFDGREQPDIEMPLVDFLSKPQVGAVAYEAARGYNRYGAISYDKSLKITIDETGAWDRLYYHVGYHSITMARTRLPAITEDEKPSEAFARVSDRQTLSLVCPNSVLSFVVTVPKTITAAELRSLRLELEADLAPTVNAPLGDFFCQAAGLKTFDSQPMAANAETGELTCRFPMPAERGVTIRLSSRSNKPIPIKIEAKTAKLDPLPPYRLYAQYSRDRSSTRPMRDLPFANIQGEGRFVGVTMHIENPTPAWWGEGDEKIYVDGDTFPRFFGTGTEDYLGYAWSNPQTFIRPYHGQPHCDGPGTFGHSTLYRWHMLDSIPFKKSFKFDMEMWHWQEVEATWDRVAFWYAKPGSTGIHDYSVEPIAELIPSPPVKGAIEGEKLKILTATGGTHEVQGGFFELSDGKQLWWIDGKPGNEIVFEIPRPRGGNKFKLSGSFCHARDYGRHELFFEGSRLGEFDFYGTGVAWKKIELGSVEFKGPTAKLTVRCTGTNPAAEPRHMFGLDYLILEPVPG